MISTYHNHTDWSDGKSSFGEMVEYAVDQQVDELGVADHFCIFPDGSSRWWSIEPTKVRDYVDQIHSFKGRNDISILVGLEIDWFKGHGDTLSPILDELHLDYRFGSLHHVDEEPFDKCFSPEKSDEELLGVWRRYWELEREMATSGLFDAVAHIDIPKRLGYFPERVLEKRIDEALDAIAAHKLVVEVNTAGYALPCNEAYASPGILEKCKERDIPVTLSADGHEPSKILFEFERGLKILQKIGYTKIARFTNREIRYEPLDLAFRRAKT